MAKVFVGTWLTKEARVKLKIACAQNNVYQGDVIELLIMKWLNEKHIKNE